MTQSKEARVSAKSPKKGAAKSESPLRRREQQRAVETRLTILKASLVEFAEKGFDAASIRNIASRTGLQHPLITYHYRSKEILWRAVAEHAFGEIGRLWDTQVETDPTLTPLQRVEREYRAFLRFTMEYPDFHHFMLRENRPGNPRLPWLTHVVIQPLLQRVLPQIRASQAAGQLPQGDPVLIHYMLIGAASVLSSLGAEISEATGLVPYSPSIVDSYWSIIEQTIFRAAPPRPAQTEPEPGAPNLAAG
jgi:AcrR family transcriptional regulator